MDIEKLEKKRELKQLLKEMFDEGEIEIRVQEVLIAGRLEYTTHHKVQVAIDGRIWYEKVDGWDDGHLKEQHREWQHCDKWRRY